MSIAASPPGGNVSLLFPPNPASLPAESVPRGGILLNTLRLSPPTNSRRFSDPDSPPTPLTPLSPTFANSPIATPSSTGLVLSPSGNPTKIRFAPLPDPRRPRSLSTGRNIVWKEQVAEDGSTRRAIELRDVGPGTDGGYGQGADEYEEEDAALDDDEEEGSDDGEGGSRSRPRTWSKTMSMGMGSWKGTKKLLTGKIPKAAEEGYAEGAPLKKSVSTGGFIGSSPFRWTSETERKRSMQGPLAPTVTSQISHRRNSSLEPSASPGNPASLGSSPTPVKLLNGRVYGSRRASEAAAREKQLREANEPAFVEWGHGKSGGGLGSNAAASSSGRGFLGDAEDGSGMEWVKRRRERREKEERERRESERSAGSGSGAEGVKPIQLARSQSSPSDGTYSSPSTTRSEQQQQQQSLVTPSFEPDQMPPAPLIHVSEAPSSPHAEQHKAAPLLDETKSMAINVPAPSRDAAGHGHGHDIFDSADPRRGHDQAIEDDEDEEDEDEEDEEGAGGDFEPDEEDEEEERAQEQARQTSSAAGVEVISRHRELKA